jgi:hypothetical protein
MPGIRIAHSDIRGRPYVVTHPTRRLRQPMFCGRCNTVHTMKTYHLDLDGEGSVVVSETVFQRLREAGMPGLEALNHVANPPTQHVSITDETPPAYVGGVTEGFTYQGKFKRLAVAKNRLLSVRRPHG